MINNKYQIIKKYLPTVIVFLCMLLMNNCAGTETVYQEEKSFSVYPQAKHLIFIGLDGWGGAYTEKADMPVVKRMMAQGAATLDMQCVMPSKSAPNWTAIFCGNPPDNHAFDQSTTILSLIDEEKSALFYEWEYIPSIFANNNIHKQKINSDLESTENIAAYIITNKPLVTIIVFNEPDHTGLWGTRRYYRKLTEMDGYIGIIEQAVMDAGIYNETVFVLTADHGGVIWGHGRNTPKQRKIPLVIYGNNIKEGYIIQSKLSIVDIAPTMAAILGFEKPSVWSGETIFGVFK